ncbi:MAG: response regulator transcription factor [Peptococcaceae bacterium]|nr:response regulator transcription factor [Peptococcaceae bacterium]
MRKEKILIIEDEQNIVSFLTTILAANDYQVLSAFNGKEAISIAASHAPDLILLDLGLPDMDGALVLQQVREWTDTPLIVVSARQDEQEKVRLLDMGANDYMTKPFGNSELLARIRTALRQHTRLKNGGAQPGNVFTANLLRIDYTRRLITIDNQPVHLTPIEYKLVILLAKYAGMVLTHDYILHEIWGPYASDNQLLRVNMANIRRKIEPNPADPQYLLTEVGVGYRLIDGTE